MTDTIDSTEQIELGYRVADWLLFESAPEFVESWLFPALHKVHSASHRKAYSERGDS